MSAVSAIGANEVNFKGDNKKFHAVKAPKIKGAEFGGKPSIGEKLTAPIKDSFKKAYGEDAEPTPSLVADFVADNVVKIGVAVAGFALLFAKSRKATNGLTQALKENADAMKTAASNGQKANIFKKAVDITKGAYNQVKQNNLNDAMEAAKDAAASGKKPVVETVKDSLLRSTEFNGESGLGKFINKNAGKHADTIKNGLGKVGIKDGGQLVDTAIAGVATAVVGSEANEIADDVTSKDNKKLAIDAKVKSFEKTLALAEKFADAATTIYGQV